MDDPKWYDLRAGTGSDGGERRCRFVLTAYGPLNFALANCDSATGGFQRGLLTSRRDAAVLDLTDPQHRYYFLHGTRAGLGWIASNPDRFVSLALKKLAISIRARFDLWYRGIFLGRSGTRLPSICSILSWGSVVQLLWHGELPCCGAWIQKTILFPRGRTVLAATLLFFGYVRLDDHSPRSTPSGGRDCVLPADSPALITQSGVPSSGVHLVSIAVSVPRPRKTATTARRNERAGGGQLNRDAPIRIDRLIIDASVEPYDRSRFLAGS
jgi:hypothetical protein